MIGREIFRKERFKFHQDYQRTRMYCMYEMHYNHTVCPPDTLFLFARHQFLPKRSQPVLTNEFLNYSCDRIPWWLIFDFWESRTFPLNASEENSETYIAKGRLNWLINVLTHCKIEMLSVGQKDNSWLLWNMCILCMLWYYQFLNEFLECAEMSKRCIFSYHVLVMPKNDNRRA